MKGALNVGMGLRQEGRGGEGGHSYKFGGRNHKGGMEINGGFRNLWSCSAPFTQDLTTTDRGWNISED